MWINCGLFYHTFRYIRISIIRKEISRRIIFAGRFGFHNLSRPVQLRQHRAFFISDGQTTAKQRRLLPFPMQRRHDHVLYRAEIRERWVCHMDQAFATAGGNRIPLPKSRQQTAGYVSFRKVQSQRGNSTSHHTGPLRHGRV